jgi:hypothetical protein
MHHTSNEWRERVTPELAVCCRGEIVTTTTSNSRNITTKPTPTTMPTLLLTLTLTLTLTQWEAGSSNSAKLPCTLPPTPSNYTAKTGALFSPRATRRNLH